MGALQFRGTTRAHAFAVLALLAAMVFRFHRLVFEGLVRLEDEMADEYYPLANSVFTQIRHGSFPTWSPEILCGYPAALLPDLHVFSPFSVPFLLAPPHLAVAIQVFLALLLAGLLLYALARRLEMSVPAATLAAILWTSGAMSDSLQSVSMPLATVPWIPLVVLCWDHFAGSRDARWAVASGGAMGLLVLSGQTQLAYWTVGYLVGFHLLLGGRSGVPMADGRAARGALLAFVVAALTSAALVLPTRQVLADSIRASLEPGERVPGSVLSLRETSRALRSVVFTTGSTSEGDADLRHAGPLAVALALLAWGRGRRLDNRLLILAACFLTFSLGTFFAPSNWALRHLPLNEFRYPSRIGLFSTLSFVLLAGRGFDRLVAGEARRLPNLLSFAALALGCVPHIRVLLRSGDALEASEGRLALACLLLVAFCLALPAGDGSIRGNLRRLALAGAALACVFHARVMTDLPSTWVTVRAWGRDAGAWGHLDAPLEPYPPAYLGAIPRSDAHGPVRWLQLDSPWEHDLSLLTGQQTPLGLVSLRPGRLDRLVYARRVASDERAPLDRTLLAHPALLDVVNVQYLVVDPDRFDGRFGSDGSGGRFVARRRVGRFVLVENRSYLPRAFFLDKAEWVRGEEAARERISAEGFDPRRLLILEGAVEALPAEAGDPLLLPATVTRYENERVEVLVAAPRDGFAVLLDRWAPGWSARLDGRQVPLLRADYLFRAVRVPAGRHRLVFEYDNAPLRWGLLLSSAGLIPVLFTAGSLLRSRRR